MLRTESATLMKLYLDFFASTGLKCFHFILICTKHDKRQMSTTGRVDLSLCALIKHVYISPIIWGQTGYVCQY